MDSADYLDAMGVMQDEYRRNLPGKIRDLNEAWAQLEMNSWDPQPFQLLIRLAHRLAGSGGSYGFEAVSEAAHRLELYAKSLNGTVPLAESERAQIKLYLAQLASIVDAVQDSSGSIREE